MNPFRVDTEDDAARGCHKWVAAGLAVLVLLVTAPGVLACDVEIGNGGTVSLSGNFVFDCVIVHVGGQLNLKRGSITITDAGGLTCDGTINIGTGGDAELALTGSSPFAWSTVDGTLNVLPRGTLRLDPETLSVGGTLSVAGSAVIDGGLSINGDTSTASGTIVINDNGALTVTGGGTFAVSGALSVDGWLRILSIGSTLVLEEGGALSVDGLAIIEGGPCHLAAARLVLANGGSTTVNGTILLKNCRSVIEISGSAHTFTGAGTVIGEHNLARILDDPVDPAGLTIDTDFTIQGALKIRLDLVNNGRVRANEATTPGTRDRLTLDGGTFTGSGLFEVNRANAYLEFDATGVTATGLATDFTVSAGTLDVEVSVCTTGDLTFTGGTIEVASGESFSVGGGCTCE